MSFKGFIFCSAFFLFVRCFMLCPSGLRLCQIYFPFLSLSSSQSLFILYFSIQFIPSIHLQICISDRRLSLLSFSLSLFINYNSIYSLASFSGENSFRHSKLNAFFWSGYPNHNLLYADLLLNSCTICPFHYPL